MIDTAGTQRSRVRSTILFAFAIALALYLAWLLRHVLLLLYVSALFAVVLKPLVCYISDLRVGRWKPFRNVAIFVLLLIVFGALAAFIFLAVPPVMDDLRDFAREMPTRLPQILDKLKRLPFAGHIDVQDLTDRIEGAATGSATSVLHSLKDWASGLFTVAMGFILTVYFSLEGDVAYRWALSFFPITHRTRLDGALRRAEVRMEKWLIGQGSLMLILGLASTVTYSLLHIRYAYALGFLTGLLNIVPVIGAAVCVGLALLVAAIDSWGRVLGVIIFYVIYINVENSFLTPRIMKSSVDLPGLSILVGLVVGSELAGVVGALVSVPTAVLVSVLLDEYLVVKEDEESAPLAVSKILPS
ncbi:MAG TPA: AI-2E family transporter [Terracidiphilus sp.]|jgi:predicted PurR-regulated permease PerM